MIYLIGQRLIKNYMTAWSPTKVGGRLSIAPNVRGFLMNDDVKKLCAVPDNLL